MPPYMIDTLYRCLFFTDIYMYVRVPGYTHKLWIYMCVYTYTYTYIYVYIYCMYIYIYIMYIYIWVFHPLSVSGGWRYITIYKLVGTVWNYMELYIKWWGTIYRKLLETIFRQRGTIDKKSTIKIAWLNATFVFIWCLVFNYILRDQSMNLPYSSSQCFDSPKTRKWYPSAGIAYLLHALLSQSCNLR